MERGFVDILEKLIAKQGKEVLLNISNFKAILADYRRNDYKKESRFLLLALEAGVHKEINASNDLPLCKKQQIRLLHEDYGLTEEIAVYVVDLLALILRGDTSKSSTGIPSKIGIKEEKKRIELSCINCRKELQEEWKICPFCLTQITIVSYGRISVFSSGLGGMGYGVSLIEPIVWM